MIEACRGFLVFTDEEQRDVLNLIMYDVEREREFGVIRNPKQRGNIWIVNNC